MIAYSILFHKDFEQFEALMRAIQDPANVYAVHLDAGADETVKRQLAEYVASHANVHFVQPIHCLWAGWSLVESELRCIRLLTELNHPWRYHINLSGQDMPLRSQARIREFLNGHPRGSNYMVVLDPETDWWAPHRFQRLTFEQRLIGHSLLKVPRYKRPFLKGNIWRGGSQWKILSREFCDFLADSSNTQAYERYFRRSYMPDEQFFQTLIMNSRFKDTVIADHQRYIVFPDHTAHPKVFEADDFDELKASGKLFARKFSVRRDAAVVRRIQSELIDAPAPERELAAAAGGAR